MTLNVGPGIRTLRDVRIVREIEATLAEACERGCFRVVAYGIQPDHAHLVVEVDDRRGLARGMLSIVPRIARAVNRVLERTGPVFRDRYYLRVARTPLEVRTVLSYC